jgi:hypothetical protein
MSSLKVCIQNPFYDSQTWIKNVKIMGKNEFYSVLAIFIIGLASIILPIAFSYLTAGIRIANSGKIITVKTPITYESEIRGVFIHEAIYGVPHNWTLIAETLASYGVNAVFVNDQGGFGRRPDSEITAAINAFHAYGIQYHSAVRTLGSTRPVPSLGTEMIRSDGSVYNVYWQCPIKAHDYVLNSIQWYLGNHSNVDGIMWDYIRYDVADNCYCDEHRTQFDQWYYENYGEHVSNWTEFYPDQPKWTIYAEWRSIPINTLVRDLHDLVKSINPNIVISEAAWTLFDDCPIYWRKWIGQDTAYWIKEDYIDFVAPMMYTKEITGSSSTNLANCTIGNLKYWMGGQPEGPIPLVALLRNDYGADSLPPQDFKGEIDYVRQRGLDGWILWRYSGPGCYLSGSPNIVDYLSAINMTETFTVTNINVETTANSATIAWLTTLPTTGKVEYSINPLFNSSWKTQSDFHFWNITYALGAMVIDYANVTEHSVTITGLSPETRYYFRIQSVRTSGIVTSRVWTFTTS